MLSEFLKQYFTVPYCAKYAPGARRAHRIYNHLSGRKHSHRPSVFAYWKTWNLHDYSKDFEELYEKFSSVVLGVYPVRRALMRREQCT